MSSDERTEDDDLYVDERTHWPQIVGSIVVAIAIVAVTLLITTAQFGTTSSAEIEAQEERRDQIDARQDALEERREEAAERREEAAE